MAQQERQYQYSPPPQPPVQPAAQPSPQPPAFPAQPSARPYPPPAATTAKLPRRTGLIIGAVIAVVAIVVVVAIAYLFILKPSGEQKGEISVGMEITPSGAHAGESVTAKISVDNQRTSSISVYSIDFNETTVNTGERLSFRLDPSSAGWQTGEVPGKSRTVVWQLTFSASAGTWDEKFTAHTSAGDISGSYRFTVLE